MEYCQILYKVIQGDLLRDLLAMINCWYFCVNLLGILKCTVLVKSLTPVPGSHESISTSANRSSWEVEGQGFKFCILSSYREGFIGLKSCVTNRKTPLS